MTALELDGVGVRFGALAALDDVTTRLDEGELTALIGPNGAGKSTLTNVVCGALPVHRGTIRFAGRPVPGGRPDRVAASGLVRTFQGLDLFEGLTVEQNVIAGAAARRGFWPMLLHRPGTPPIPQPLRDAARHALDIVGLAHRAHHPASILPAGQRRLLAVARAYATGARWLVLDEPGAGLNKTEKALLVGMIRRLHESGRTILFIEHDMDVVHSLARRILVLDRGRLIADGTPAEVRNDRRVITAYLGAETDRPPATIATSRPPPLIEARGLSVAYGNVRALGPVHIQVGAGELVAVVGANGAGKSTLLKALAGVLQPREGSVHWDGAPTAGLGAQGLVRRGVVLVPEGRELFASLTVEDNLLLGAWSQAGLAGRLGAVATHRRASTQGLDRVYALFPRLRERRRQLAGGLSGGEAQMVAIGRALMARPRLLLLDEPSLGLEPMLVQEILDRLLEMRAAGLAILVVEQMARAALLVADHGYVLERGQVLHEGPGPALLEAGHLADAYLGPATPPAQPILERT